MRKVEQMTNRTRPTRLADRYSDVMRRVLSHIQELESNSSMPAPQSFSLSDVKICAIFRVYRRVTPNQRVTSALVDTFYWEPYCIPSPLSVASAFTLLPANPRSTEVNVDGSAPRTYNAASLSWSRNC